MGNRTILGSTEIIPKLDEMKELMLIFYTLKVMQKFLYIRVYFKVFYFFLITVKLFISSVQGDSLF